MDFARYLHRLGLPEAPSATAAGVAILQAAQRMRIGFENLDVMLGRGIQIDSDSVFTKLVEQGRGGYCFEHNRLFADALSAMGLACRPVLARTRLGQPQGYYPPRTHVAVLAEIEGCLWLTDAGFGGSNSIPLPLEDGAQAQTCDGAFHRLTCTGERGSLDGEWLLERAGAPAATDGRCADHSDWQAQYSFDLTMVAPDDLEQANHWTSTRAGTRFTMLHVVSIPTAGGFASMVDRTLTLAQAGDVTRREIADAADYAETLQSLFHITLSPEETAQLPLFKE